MRTTLMLFILTTLTKTTGCGFPYLWLRQAGSAWLLIPAVFSLALFAWLLTLHPAASGRIYAAYGGVCISAALLWCCLVNGIRPQWTDWIGIALCLSGMTIIMWGARS